MIKWAWLGIAVVSCQGEIRFAGSDGGKTDAAHAPCTTTCPLPSLVCVEGTCFECASNADCRTGRRICDVASHRCVQCGAAVDCEEPQEKVCEAQTKRCLRKCTASTECTEGNANTCDTIRGYCVECATKAQCATDRVCDTRIGQCVQCTMDSDCKADPEKRRCDPVTLSCVKCLDDRDCPTSYCDIGRRECSL